MASHLNLKPRDYADGNWSLTKVTNDYGRELPFYDNGSGHCYVWRDSTGVRGVVRADSWSLALECAEDELFDEPDGDWQYILKEFDYTPEEIEAAKTDSSIFEKLTNDGAFQEAYGYRPNGPNMRDKYNTGLYARDLNGESLDFISEEIATRFGLTLEYTFVDQELLDKAKEDITRWFGEYFDAHLSREQEELVNEVVRTMLEALANHSADGL